MSNVNYLQIGANAECGWYDEQYHYDMAEFAEWYRESTVMGRYEEDIEGLAFIKLMDKCCVPVDYKFECGSDDIYVWDFNSETVIVACTVAGIAIQVIDYAEWRDWFFNPPTRIEKVCGTCKHIDTKSGTEPCYSCDSLEPDEFNWEPQEDE